ncbi:MAG: hypothetical protein VCC99_04995 [Alphaproteobacteria bacterium]
MISALVAMGVCLTFATHAVVGDRSETSGNDILTGTIVDTTELG